MITRALEELVRARAANRCEYCQLPQDRHPWRFELDHIIAEQHGGQTLSENLALCCPRCNRHKGPNIAGIDPQSEQIVPLFNPRTMRWVDHFRWNGAVLVGFTSQARATIKVLAINDPV